MNLRFREAENEDIPILVQMLFDDELGAKREDISLPINKNYVNTFRSIKQDPNNELTVVESGSEVVGMLQLTFIPYLTHIGSWRCLIEGVRIHSRYRGHGLGRELITWAINRAKEKQCSIVQLTSDKRRLDALRFYETLGFEATHEGLKLNL